MITLDTNAVIYHTSGDTSVRDRIIRAIEHGGPMYVSAITVAELFRFPDLSVAEESATTLFLSGCSIINVDSAIAQHAGVIGRLYGLKLADSIIAATALFTGTTLLTRNTRDFKRIADLVVERI
jgi:predicted nucleic acid-binding protein